MKKKVGFPLLAGLLAALAVPALAETTAPVPDPADEPAKPAAAAPAAKPAEAPKPAAPAGLIIKVSDSINFKFGGLLQGQADWTQDKATEGYSENLFLRRARFNVGGQIGSKIFFFWQTENGSLGKAPKALGSGFQTLDAVVEWRIDKTFNVQAGQIYVPQSRESLKSSASELAIDMGAYTYTATTALGGTGGRDTGVMFRGFFLDDALEYRVLAAQGVRDAKSFNAYRYVGRLQYNFFDKEPYAFTAYAGSYLGTKKILAVGASYDFQRSYESYAVDAYWSMPFKEGSLEGIVVYQSMDGGTLVTTLPKSHTFEGELSWYFKELKTAAYGRYERRQFATGSGDEERYAAGLNYYVKGNNCNLKGAYQRLVPKVGIATNQLTLQLQLAY